MKVFSKRRLISLLAAMLTVLLLASSLGCGVEGHTRQAEFTHWHDEDTLVLVYTRQQTMGALSGIFRPTPKTTHIRVCTVEPDNALDCEHQRELTNILNEQLSGSVDLQDRWRP